MIVNYPKILRAPWDGIPDTLLIAEEGPVKANPAYQQAKTGDVAAAKTLAADFVGPPALDALQRLVGEQGIILVPVHAIEDQGINRIPAAFAELLASRLGLSVATGVVQGNVVSHTGSTGWQRMARPPVFDGPVTAGAGFLLVDDFIGQGGTLANLRGYLIANGGKVAGAVTLTGKGYSAKLSLDVATLRQLRQKHDSELEAWWEETFGYGFDCLTESEARYLIRAENADTIRARILEARS